MKRALFLTTLAFGGEFGPQTENLCHQSCKILHVHVAGRDSSDVGAALVLTGALLAGDCSR